MVLSKTLFLFTVLFLAGYYTPFQCFSQIWIAALPAGIILITAGLRKGGIIVLCSVSFLAGANFNAGSITITGDSVTAAGVWRCRVETTTTAGAVLSNNAWNTVWASGRQLSGAVSRGDSVIIIGSVNEGFMDSYTFHPIPSSLLQDRLRKAVSTGLSGKIASREASSLVSALLVGERGNLPQVVRGVFRDTGTSHLLALSGMHVGILSGIMLAIFRKLFGKGWLSILSVILTIFIYVFVSGARASTARAGLMLLLVIVVWQSSGRRPELLFVWSVAVIVLTAASRGDVLNDTGAQMSFGAVLSLIILGKQFRCRAGWILSIAFAGVVVTTALAPLVSFRYGGLSPVAPVATVISFPFMLTTMITGFMTLLGPFASAGSLLSEWSVFIWLAVLRILESGMIIFVKWMYWVWPLCLIALWLFSRRRGFGRRFR
ncbi:MAG: ComEC/Rec2 family competence protein [Candidatus Aegiribacteria sp.]|nr:ComEC/Rec2 family competence protein [Candidatus Aegiribacteria sp.]